MEAVIERSLLALCGGPRGGNSTGNVLGLTTLEAELDLRSEEELAELWDLLILKLVAVLVTNRLEGRELCGDSVGCALVKVKVKYWVFSMLHTEMMSVAWSAWSWVIDLLDRGPQRAPSRLYGSMTTSTETSRTTVLVKFELLNFGNLGGVSKAVGVDPPLPGAFSSTLPSVLELLDESSRTEFKKSCLDKQKEA